MAQPPLARPPEFCRQCGAELPPGAPRFCIECGAPTSHGELLVPMPAPAPAATGATVRLANAAVEQLVIGGTVRLPASGAVPPGLWDRDVPPGPDDVVAIYPPLRAVSRGWSGHVGRGWRAVERVAESGTTVFLFRAPVAWFPAEGCGGGLRLLVEVEATAHTTVEGRERRGFRFGLRRDGPMRVVAATWHDEHGQPVAGRPLPQIQLMAPPRVPRMRDLDEAPALLDAREAVLWAEGSRAPGAYRLRLPIMQQEHTPAGRGISLVALGEADVAGRPWWRRLLGTTPERYRVRLERPLSCPFDEWPGRLGRIREEARSLGLDLEPALAAEWWLDRHGHDGVIFSGARARFGAEQVVIVFRYRQLARIKD
ncbi:MAG: zinc ribbon domain-containing protein [Chloroflexi bacterium OHK40]